MIIKPFKSQTVVVIYVTVKLVPDQPSFADSGPGYDLKLSLGITRDCPGLFVSLSGIRGGKPDLFSSLGSFPITDPPSVHSIKEEYISFAQGISFGLRGKLSNLEILSRLHSGNPGL